MKAYEIPYQKTEGFMTKTYGEVKVSWYKDLLQSIEFAKGNYAYQIHFKTSAADTVYYGWRCKHPNGQRNTYITDETKDGMINTINHWFTTTEGTQFLGSVRRRMAIEHLNGLAQEVQMARVQYAPILASLEVPLEVQSLLDQDRPHSPHTPLPHPQAE